MSGNVWNRLSGSSMVEMGISSNIMKYPSPKCYMTFWDMTINSDTLNWSDNLPICALITELGLITDFDLITKFRRDFHRTLEQARLAKKGHLLLRSLVPVPFGTCICSNVETIFSWTFMFTDLKFRTSLGTSSLLLMIITNLDEPFSVMF